MLLQDRLRDSLRERLVEEVSGYVAAHQAEIHEEVLIQAVAKGDMKMVEYLLEDVVLIKTESLTERILEAAVASGNIQMATHLQNREDLPLPPYPDDKRLLLIAVEIGNLAMARLLLRHDRVKHSHLGVHEAITTAVRSGRTAIVRELARAQACQFVDYYGYESTLLIEASGKGDAAVVGALLEGEAEVDFVGKQELEHGSISFTALTASVSNGHFGVARMLLDAGADPNLLAPLMIAVERNDGRLVQLLLQYGARTEYFCTDGDTDSALIEACQGGSAEIVRILIDAGADLNAVDWRGKNALTYATVCGYEEIAMMLSQKGADRYQIEALLKDSSAMAEFVSSLRFYCDGLFNPESCVPPEKSVGA